MEAAERRRAPRAELRGDATIHFQEGVSLRCRLVDVSMGGVALIAPVEEPPESFVRIEFKVRADASTFDVPGQVVSTRRDGDAVVWGVRFEGLDLGTRVRLKDYLDRQWTA